MSDGDPLCHSIALNLTLSPRAQLVYCLALIIRLSLSICTHPFSVSERIFAYLPSYSDIFVAEFREMRSPRQVIHIDSQLSAPIGCQRLQLFLFPQNLTVFQFHHEQHSPYMEDAYVLCNNSTVPSSEHV